MPWYAAHAILYHEPLDGPPDGFHVFENVFLIRGSNPDEARDKAEVVARREEGDDSGSLRIGGRPARLVFGTIRKVVSVLHESEEGRLGEGDELTYSEFLVPDRTALDKLIGAKDGELTYLGADGDEG